MQLKASSVTPSRLNEREKSGWRSAPFRPCDRDGLTGIAELRCPDLSVPGFSGAFGLFRPDACGMEQSKPVSRHSSALKACLAQ